MLDQFEEQQRQRKAERMEKKRQRKFQNAARDLRRKMIKYCQDERFLAALADAVPIYWNDYYTIENADEMDPNESFRFFDWFFFDFEHEDGSRLVERFLSEKGEELNEFELAVIESWQATPAPSAFEYVDFDAFSNRFQLRDFFTGEEIVATTAAGSGEAQKGDLILTRIVPAGDELIFSTVGAYIPEDEIVDLSEKMAAAKEAYLEEHPEASDNEFMRRHSHLIIHHALDQSVEKGRFAVSRLDPTRIDKAVRRSVKKAVKKVRRRK